MLGSFCCRPSERSLHASDGATSALERGGYRQKVSFDIVEKCCSRWVQVTEHAEVSLW